MTRPKIKGKDCALTISAILIVCGGAMNTLDIQNILKLKKLEMESLSFESLKQLRESFV